ncbi:hypothetical protein [Pseudomonas guineae]|uniref:hypothetical protein n=1 Tax=Pseudomonas guineae TaxID=425504 RepID=UPI000AD8A810|tara:strand:- start:98 stop:382 length:285 start_codon:yes stop_codon:yes gene_type:complete
MSRIIEPQHYYPKIAEAAREIMGRSSRVMRAVKQQDLIAERKKSKTYRPDRKELRAKVANLASINEVILDENRVLKAKISDRKVVTLAARKPNS